MDSYVYINLLLIPACAFTAGKTSDTIAIAINVLAVIINLAVVIAHLK